MSIVWRSALEVGDQVIDGDHRHLIGLINDVETALHEEHPIDKLHASLGELERYTREHFRREEEIMLLRKYVKFDDHKAAHQALVEELSVAAKPVETLYSTGSDALPEDVKRGLVNLLRHWLLDHIVKEDTQLRPLLRA